uniref:Uncharacterized protein n=1 Tax=Knipowitschia caucasica TaxID=637954 RepID=A0AAV2K087_KNICA
MVFIREKVYGLRRRRALRGKSVPQYAALEPQGAGLMLASEKPFTFTHRDGAPIQLGLEPMEQEKTEEEVCRHERRRSVVMRGGGLSSWEEVCRHERRRSVVMRSVVMRGGLSSWEEEVCRHRRRSVVMRGGGLSSWEEVCRHERRRSVVMRSVVMRGGLSS